jgi:very-short-patch-repair endonuclease
MLTGVFRDRTRLQRLAAQTAHQALRQLVHSPLLSPHRATHQYEIGPFVVDYVFKDRSLVVELEPQDAAALPRARARAVLLNELGYGVLLVSRREVRLRPRQVLAQIKSALR